VTWIGSNNRNLGPFIDRDGRLVWFDIFAIVRQVSLVRAPSTIPFLTLPPRGFSLGAATSYELPASSMKKLRLYLSSCEFHPPPSRGCVWQ
jgi:hypothetical protein